MSKKVTEPRVNTTIRLPESLHTKLVEISNNASRSISKQVAHWVRTASVVLMFAVVSCAPEPKPTRMSCGQISSELIELHESIAQPVSQEVYNKRVERIKYLQSVDCGY